MKLKRRTWVSIIALSIRVPRDVWLFRATMLTLEVVRASSEDLILSFYVSSSSDTDGHRTSKVSDTNLSVTNYLDVRAVYLISEQIAEPRRQKQNLATVGNVGRKHVKV